MLFTILPIILILIFLFIGIVLITPELRMKLYLWQGDQNKARKMLESLLDQNPDRIGLYLKLGEIYYMENRRDRKAMRVFELILKLKADFPYRDDIYTIVAKHYIQEGRKDSEAIRLIERAVDGEMNRFKATA